MGRINRKNLVLLFLGVLVLALFINLPNTSSIYMVRVLNMTMITYLAVLSLYVVFGMAGQSSFAQCGLMGIGAYITANVSTRWGYLPILGMAASMLGTALFAFIIGFALFRLRRFYFSFSTIALMTILNGIFANWTKGTGGPVGMGNLVQFSVGNFIFNTEAKYYYLILGFSIAASIIIWKLFRSPLGRSFMAVRDNETAASCMGVNILLTKNIAFAISGLLCGLAGSLFAFLSGYISATSFALPQSQLYLVVIMIGGSSSPIGALIGSILINLLPEWLRFLKDYMMLIYGVGIMGLMIVLPEGLVGGGKDLYAKLIKWKRSRADAEQGL